MSKTSGRSCEVLASRVPVHRGTAWSPPRVCLCTHQCCSCPYSPISTIKTASFTLVKIDLLGQFWQHRSSASKQASNQRMNPISPIPPPSRWRRGTSHPRNEKLSWWVKKTYCHYILYIDREERRWMRKQGTWGISNAKREFFPLLFQFSF